MKNKVTVNIALICCFITATLLAGCNNNSVSTPAKDRAYFSAHLDEAKQMNGDCLAKGPAGMSETELATCRAAGDAWRNQPYKPTGGAWSSKGGNQ